jgi:hypothetical protein
VLTGTCAGIHRVRTAPHATETTAQWVTNAHVLLDGLELLVPQSNAVSVLETAKNAAMRESATTTALGVDAAGTLPHPMPAGASGLQVCATWNLPLDVSVAGPALPLHSAPNVAVAMTIESGASAGASSQSGDQRFNRGSVATSSCSTLQHNSNYLTHLEYEQV